MTPDPSRRGVLALTAALAALPTFTATAAPQRPADAPALDADPRHRLRWQAPADEHSMIEQGLPVGNGRLGALASNDPGREVLLVTDATLWTGGLNDTLDADGQFPYGRQDFGSFTLLARLTVDIPDHDLSAVSGYRRTLDLAQGVNETSYVRSGVTYRRQIFASRPDDVIVLHFDQSGGGRYTGTITLEGTHGEEPAVSFGAALPNGLRYGAAIAAYGSGGSVTVEGTHIGFTGCRELTVVLSGGTNYTPDAAAQFRDPSLDPQQLARTKVRAAARHSANTLLRTHTADHHALFGQWDVSLGTSSAEQRSSTPGSACAHAPGTESPTPNWRPSTCSSAAT